jgi:hypothetical protein
MATRAVHRLQRVRWLLSLAPHFGQRRLFRFKTSFVRGRDFMVNAFQNSQHAASRVALPIMPTSRLITV